MLSTFKFLAVAQELTIHTINGSFSHQNLFSVTLNSILGELIAPEFMSF